MAILEITLERDESIAKAFRCSLARTEQMKRQTFCGLGSDTGELTKLLNGLLNLRGQERHEAEDRSHRAVRHAKAQNNFLHLASFAHLAANLPLFNPLPFINPLSPPTNTDDDFDKFSSEYFKRNNADAFFVLHRL